MTTFTIPEGGTWAGSMWERHRTGVSGVRRTQENTSWVLSIDMSDCPVGTTIKVCGLAWLYFSFKRINKRGWSDLSAFTHEESDRLIATRTKEGRINLRAYSYVNGDIVHGPRSTTVRNNEQFKYGITIRSTPAGSTKVKHNVWTADEDSTTDYGIPKIHQWNLSTKYRDRSIPFLCHRSFAHAIGHNQEVSPGDIDIHVYEVAAYKL